MNLLKVGLTGGIGSGKSTAIEAFIDLGVDIIDADQIARDIVKPDTKALAEISKLFGKEILQSNGELNRNKLKSIIFAQSKAGEKALADLEKITHPIIRAEIQKQIFILESKKLNEKENKKNKNIPYLIVDIPLLIEKNYETMFDRLVVVDCTKEQQIKRVQKRDDMDDATIKKIIEKQASREERKKVATDILDNSTDIESLLSQVSSMHQNFLSLSES